MVQKIIVVILCTALNAAAFAAEFDVLTPTELENTLRAQLRVASHAALDRRQAAYEQLATPEAIGAYQKKLRASFLNCLGDFPRRSPLKAQLVGTLPGDGFRVEKVVFQSRPGFHVTANVYLPLAKPPFPAVLVPCGHSPNGKSADAYQKASILMAQHGIAVLCYDPIGQGERKQILKRDSHGKPLAEGRFSPTTEHMFDGVAAILLGQNLATYGIWDAMRSLDYLCGREDVDSQRLGCTGNSGGGMMTSYLMALDERVFAAAPGCFITTTRRKNDQPGPGDIEQNLFGQLRYGLDHPDFLILHAPKPTLICAATQDFVPIEGTWEAFRQAKRIYTKLGVSDRIDLIEANEKHGFSRPLRVGVTRWMRRWLLGKDEAIVEREIEVFTEKQLRCTPDGQVLLLKDAKSIFDFHRQTAGELAQKRAANAERTDSELRNAIRSRAQIRKLDSIEVPTVQKRGRIKRAGYQIKKLVLKHESILPALYFIPSSPNGNAVVYVHADGKSAGSERGGDIETLALSGHQVIAVDLRGFGENAMKPWRFSGSFMGNNAAEFFVAYMLGQSLVRMQTEDILATTVAVKSILPKDSDIQLVAVGKAGIPALHAAALEPTLFSRVTIRNSLSSWESVIDVGVTADQLESTIHGVLRDYDLADLARLIGPDRVSFESPIQGLENEGK